LRPAIEAASSEDRRNGIPIVAFRANCFALKCERERHDAIFIPANVNRNRVSKISANNDQLTVLNGFESRSLQLTRAARIPKWGLRRCPGFSRLGVMGMHLASALKSVNASGARLGGA
jgi:hypothetical protein